MDVAKLCKQKASSRETLLEQRAFASHVAKIPPVLLESYIRP